MPSEQINFTFILTAYGITDYIPVDILVNNNVVHSENISVNGRKTISTTISLEQGPANVSIAVTENQHGSVRVENIKVAWVNDSTSVNSSWTMQNDNEIWCYNDPDTVNAFNRIVNGTGAKVIALDYVTDETVPSYIRNYAFAEDEAGNRIELKTLKGQYVFNKKGRLTLPMTSPISYWLMERLFVAI